jgi:CheY-like chemotaxis protein
VLLVDDEPAVIEAAQEYLATFGFQVDAAMEREEAEALLAKRAYGLLIADLRLTGIHGREGFELVRYVREHQPLCAIVVLTAYGSADLQQEAQRIGADAFLQKPLPLPELHSVIVRLLEVRGPWSDSR